MRLHLMIGCLCVGIGSAAFAQTKSATCAVLLQGLSHHLNFPETREGHLLTAWDVLHEFRSRAGIPRATEGRVGSLQLASHLDFSEVDDKKLARQIRGIELQLLKPGNYPDSELWGIHIQKDGDRFLTEWREEVERLELNKKARRYMKEKLVGHIVANGIMSFMAPIGTPVVGVYSLVSILNAFRRLDDPYDLELLEAVMDLHGEGWAYVSWQTTFQKDAFDVLSQYRWDELALIQNNWDLAGPFARELDRARSVLFQRLKTLGRGENHVSVDMLAQKNEAGQKSLTIFLRMGPQKPKSGGGGPKKKREKKHGWKPAYQQV